MPTYERFDESELMRFTSQVFQAAGVPAEHAHTVATNLVQSELHGMGSHGISRLLEIYTQRFQAGGVNPNPNITIIHRSGSTALIDGDHGPGAVAGQRAMDLALELARDSGSGWVGIRNSSHFGAAFLFARRALPEGMIGFATTNAPAEMAPAGGTRPTLGTNPFCIAVPTGRPEGMILDMATTVVAKGKVFLAEYEGHTIPQGWAVDATGKTTTNPSAVRGGRMLPLAGYKGFGLATMVEVFSALLTGAMTGVEMTGLYGATDSPQQLGHFVGALQISRFVPLEEFTERVNQLIAYIKDSPLEEGASEILVPGEMEGRKAALYRSAGIPIAVDVTERLNGLAAGLGVVPLQNRV